MWSKTEFISITIRGLAATFPRALVFLVENASL